MKKLIVLLSSITVSLSLALTGNGEAAAPAGAKTVVLKQNVYTPAGHDFTLRCTEFGRRVTEATQGRVKIEIYPSESLCPAKEELAAARAGTIDMTATVMSYIVGSLPVFNFGGLPWGTPPTPESTAKAVLEAMPTLQKALDRYDVHLLYLEMVPGVYCLVTRKEIRTPAQMKGLKIRTAGGLTDSLAVTWGAGVVSVPAPETYTSLQRGLVDAGMFSATSVKPFRLHEVAPFITDIAMGMNGIVMAVNKGKWQQISPADQKAISALVPEFTLWNVQGAVAGNNRARAEFPGMGMKVYNPAPAEMDLWKAGAKPLWDKYAETSADAKQMVEILLKHGGGVK